MPEILVIQHNECVPVGTIGDVLEESLANTKFVRTYLGDAVPSSVDGIDGLVIMGGSMGVYEQGVYTYLSQEIDLIKEVIKADIPILGICLGGQLISAALGGDVYLGAKKEIGWHSIYITPAAQDDALFGKLECFTVGSNPNFVGFSWHGDYFTLPDGAVRLAYSDLCENHAVRYGTNVYAVQFHPEVSESTVKEWLVEFAEDAEAAQVDRDAVVKDTLLYADAQRRAAIEIGRRWLDLVDRTK